MAAPLNLLSSLKICTMENCFQCVNEVRLIIQVDPDFLGHKLHSRLV
jgi:hypothetical protein